MELYYIYGLFDPTTNRLRYIGYTARTLEKRFNDHINQAKKKGKKTYKSCWIRSLLDTGLKPEIKLIETIYNGFEETLKREVYWIKYFKKRFDLTNHTNGGDGIKGYKWSKKLHLQLSKKVCQYDLKGNLLKTFTSISNAARYLNKEGQDGKISQVCKGKYGRNTFLGFVWRYEGDSFDKFDFKFDNTGLKSEKNRERARKNQTGKTNSFAKPLMKYDLNMNFIKEYDLAKEVCQEFGIKNIQWLKVQMNNNKPYKGFYWKFKIKTN